jgi:WD repeat-containing protein 20
VHLQSYYGGLLCCGWSPDGNYVAAGGEDDLVSVFGLQERCVVAWAEGHSSWVTGIAFDPWCAPFIDCFPVLFTETYIGEEYTQC